MSTEQQRQAWQIAGISIVFLLLLTLVLYWQTVQYLTSLWGNIPEGNYGHGYLVLAISVYLIISNRRILLEIKPCPSLLALFAVMSSGLLWLAAVLTDVNMMQTVGLLLLISSALWLVTGSRVTGHLLFPVLYIGFALPVWFPLSPLLQDLTADTVFWLIRLLEVPALREENVIVLPAGKLSVEEACSGLRYLLAALTLGTLYAYLNYQSAWDRMLVVFISVLTAILANIIRVFIVVYLGYTTDMQHPYVHDHLMLGWYLFGVLLVLLLIIDVLVYKYRQQVSRDKTEYRAAEREGRLPVICKKGRFQHLLTVIFGALCLSLGPAAAYKVNHQQRPVNVASEIDLPAGSGGWTGPLLSEDDWMPEYHGAVTAKQAYIKGADKVTLYLGYYPVQKQGEELINGLNRISNEDVWRPLYPHARAKHVGHGQVLEQLLTKHTGGEKLVWYWYRVAGRDTTSRYEAKLYQLQGLITGRPQAYLLAVAADIKSGGDAREVLFEFVNTMSLPLREVLAANK